MTKILRFNVYFYSCSTSRMYFALLSLKRQTQLCFPEERNKYFYISDWQLVYFLLVDFIQSWMNLAMYILRKRMECQISVWGMSHVLDSHKVELRKTMFYLISSWILIVLLSKQSASVNSEKVVIPGNIPINGLREWKE